MIRPITLVGFTLLAACLNTAEAQQAGSIGEQFVREGKEQVDRARKYKTAPKAQAYMSATAPRRNYASDDVSGRLDMSGRVPPAYFKLRDNSSPVSRRRYTSIAPRRAVPPSNYYSKTASTPSPSAGRASARGAIPPAPR